MHTHVPPLSFPFPGIGNRVGQPLCELHHDKQGFLQAESNPPPGQAQQLGGLDPGAWSSQLTLSIGETPLEPFWAAFYLGTSPWPAFSQGDFVEWLFIWSVISKVREWPSIRGWFYQGPWPSEWVEGVSPFSPVTATPSPWITMALHGVAGSSMDGNVGQPASFSANEGWNPTHPPPSGVVKRGSGDEREREGGGSHAADRKGGVSPFLPPLTISLPCQPAPSGQNHHAFEARWGPIREKNREQIIWEGSRVAREFGLSAICGMNFWWAKFFFDFNIFQN